MTATIHTTCRMCEGALKPVLDLGWTPLANALCVEPCTPNQYPLALVRCCECGHFQLPIQVDPAELFPPTYPYASGASESMRSHLEEVGMLLADKLKLGARVLEIGCNDGYLLDCMRDQGLVVMGVDPAASPDVIRRHSVICEPWGGEREMPVGEFDAVVGLNVFAHVDNLRRSIWHAVKVLNPGGVLMLEVGYFPAMVERNVFDTIYHEHLDYHTLGAMVPFLERVGLRVFDAELLEVQGGSVRVWAKRDDGHTGWIKSPELQRLMGKEKETLSCERLERWVVSVQDFGEKLGSELRTKRVLGYGCPAKSTTLLAASSLEVDAFIDDNPLKVGKRAPDGRTPILANTADLDERFTTDTTVVVFAWNMIEEVTRRIRSSPARCLREATIVVPFPTPHVVAS